MATGRTFSIEAVLAGDRLALARLLTEVENDTPAGQAALDELYPHSGQAHIVGITGAPGTGKSSLVNQLARVFRRMESPRKVGIIAVDPTSPFTGGAILGDRLRMRDLAGDPGIFIRSMAARGALGGLARTTAAVTRAMDAAGFDLILIETVGAGQSEVDIARLAYTTVVIEAPGLGDDIQAIKAGILEIADILVINKADRPGVENTERSLRNMLEFGHPTRWADSAAHHAQTGPQPVAESADFWLPPVLKTIAIQDGLPHGRGIVEVADAIDRHATHLQHSGELEVRRRLRLQDEVQHLLLEALHTRWLSSGGDGRMEQVLLEVYDRRVSPARAAQTLAAGVQTP